jgi:hypothetical protein
LQDRVPGEPFAAKPSKDAEMEKIMRSMEVDILTVIYVISCKYVKIQILQYTIDDDRASQEPQI